MKSLFALILVFCFTGCIDSQFSIKSTLPERVEPIPTPTPTPDPTTFYTFLINYNSLCLTINSSGNLEQNTCDSSSDQKFEIVEDSSLFQIKKPNSTTDCLTYVSGQSEIYTATCDENAAEQKWERILTSSGDYQIKNVSSGDCWNIPNAYTTPGLELILYSCGSSGSEEQNEVFNISESTN